MGYGGIDVRAERSRVRSTHSRFSPATILDKPRVRSTDSSADKQVAHEVELGEIDLGVKRPELRRLAVDETVSLRLGGIGGL